jgi:hypothetical protein
MHDHRIIPAGKEIIQHVHVLGCIKLHSTNYHHSSVCTYIDNIILQSYIYQVSLIL